MNLFKLEDYLAQHEFSAQHLLCCSDAESFTLAEILDMADAEETDQWHNLRLGYTETQGHPALRHILADSLYSGLKADHILTFAGAEEGIYCALHTLIAPHDHVIILTPCYQSLLEVPAAKNAHITTVALREEHDWRIDLDAIKDAIRPSTRCIVMNFPHNPTGQIISEADLRALIQLCEPQGIWLFSDEVYRLLGAPGTAWAQPAACLYPRALSLGVMSKSYGLAGLRIGWIACQDNALLKKIVQMKYYTSICNSAPSEILARIALRNQARILQRNNTILANNLTLLDIFFSDYAQRFSWVRPKGGCVGYVHDHASESVASFCDRLVKSRGVLLMPSSIYNHASNHFRIGFGRRNMPTSLNRLRDFLSHEVL